jgi:hypothetical protein
MFDFNFLKERKAEAILDVTSSNILEFVQQLSPMERSAALAWANAALLAGVEEYGRAIAYAPMRLAPETCLKAVTDFATYHKQVEESSGAANDRPANDPAVSAFKWEMLASQAVIVTAGAKIHLGARAAARQIWPILGKATPYAQEAAAVMMAYARTYEVEPVPPVPRKKSDKALLLGLASVLPPMYR